MKDLSDASTRVLFVQLKWIKWLVGILFMMVPHKHDFVGDPVFQLVFLVKYQQTMIQIAHDQLGHQGVHKTYNNLLQYFFFFFF